MDEATDVKVCFVYTLDTSNGSSMTRAGGDEIFNQFYQKISSGELIPDDYELTLTETTSGLKYTFKGKWSSKDMITIRTGNYKVEGKSQANGEYIQEKCSIIFNQEIDVNASTSTIQLTAQYDCSLLVFDNTNINKVEVHTYHGTNPNYIRTFFDLATYKYAFVNGDIYNAEALDEEYHFIYGEFTNESSFKIYTKNLILDKGKYYVYNSISNSFTIPKMEQGE